MKTSVDDVTKLSLSLKKSVLKLVKEVKEQKVVINELLQFQNLHKPLFAKVMLTNVDVSIDEVNNSSLMSVWFRL